MTNNPYLIKNIEQKDNHTFAIQWNDGITRNYRLSELQVRCPCAGCVDEVTGERLIDASKIDYNVKAKRVASVGRYALRIDFTSGCSHGIYTYEMLRKMF